MNIPQSNYNNSQYGYTWNVVQTAAKQGENKSAAINPTLPKIGYAARAGKKNAPESINEALANRIDGSTKAVTAQFGRIDTGNSDTIGTRIPWLQNMYTDLIVNPSSVSLSEFQRMTYSKPVISVGLTILKNLVVSKIDTFQHKNKKYVEYMEKLIKGLKTPFKSVLEEMFTGVSMGFYLGEKIYNSDGRYVFITDIAARPASSIVYRCDPAGNIKEDGVIQYYFNNMWTGYGNLLSYGNNGNPNPYANRGDMNYPWRTIMYQPIGTVVIPRSKCVHYAYQGTDGLSSPYGRSLLRSAYDYTLAHTEMLKNNLIAANFKASNLPIVTINPEGYTNAVDQNTGEKIDPVANADAAMASAAGGNSYLVMVGEVGKSIYYDEFKSVADISDLLEMTEYLDKIQLISVLLPSEMAGLSDKGSFGLGEIQKDLLDRNVESIALHMKESLIRDIAKPMLQLNFGETEDFGTWGMRDDVAEDIELNIQILQELKAQGYKVNEKALAKMLGIEADSLEKIPANEMEQNQGQPANNKPGKTPKMKLSEYFSKTDYSEFE